MAAPPNDNWMGTTINQNGANVNGTNVEATKQQGEPNHAANAGGKSIWYSFSVTGTSRPITLSTAGSGFDTLLGVYKTFGGFDVAHLQEVASNDDESAGVTTSALTFNAITGTLYHVAIDGKNGASGAVQLTLTSGTPPPTYDLTHTQPIGWSSRLVISAAAGTSADSPIGPADTPHFDYAITNFGSASTPAFFADLYLDDVLLERREFAGGVGSNSIVAAFDIAHAPLSEDVHKVSLVIDPTGAVAETSEINNTVERFFTVGDLPRVISSEFQHDTLPQQLRVRFSTDVSASLGTNDFFIRRRYGTPTQVTPTSLQWDGNTKTAIVNLPDVLADGYYIATLSSAGITNANGGRMDGDANGTPGPDRDEYFHFLLGDVNNDAQVGFVDLITTAAKFGSPGAYKEGDVDYSGSVNFSDLLMVSARFGVKLQQEAPLPAPAVKAAKRKPPIADILDSR